MMIKLQKCLATDRQQLCDTNCFRTHQFKSLAFQFLQVYSEGCIATLLFLFCPCLSKDYKYFLHFHINPNI